MAALAKQYQATKHVTYNFNVHGKNLAVRKYAVRRVGRVARRCRNCACSRALPQLTPNSCHIFDERSFIRRMAVWLVHWPLFDRFILAVVLVNAVILGMADYSHADSANNLLNTSWRNRVVSGSEPFFTSVFVAEALLKIVAHGFVWGRDAYLKDSWNRLDFVVVVAAYVYPVFLTCICVAALLLHARLAVNVFLITRAACWLSSPARPTCPCSVPCACSGPCGRLLFCLVSALWHVRCPKRPVMIPAPFPACGAGMRTLITALFASLPALVNIFLAIIFVLFVYGIIGLYLLYGLARLYVLHLPFRFTRQCRCVGLLPCCVRSAGAQHGRCRLTEYPVTFSSTNSSGPCALPYTDACMSSYLAANATPAVGPAKAVYVPSLDMHVSYLVDPTLLRRCISITSEGVTKAGSPWHAARVRLSSPPRRVLVAIEGPDAGVCCMWLLRACTTESCGVRISPWAGCVSRDLTVPDTCWSGRSVLGRTHPLPVLQASSCA